MKDTVSQSDILITYIAVYTCAFLFIFSDTVGLNNFERHEIRVHNVSRNNHSPTYHIHPAYNNTTMAASYEDMSDSDDDDEECRVCRGPAEEG